VSAVARAQSLGAEAEATLRSLYESTPAARALGPTAKGILVFPNIFSENYALGGQALQSATLHDGEGVPSQNGVALPIRSR